MESNEISVFRGEVRPCPLLTRGRTEQTIGYRDEAQLLHINGDSRSL